jgi:hypothetical protein
MEYSQKDQKIVKCVAWFWTLIYLTISPLFFYGAFFGGVLALDFQGGTYFHVVIVSGILLTIPSSMTFTIYCMWRRILGKKFKGINYIWLIPFMTGGVAIGLMFICF